jgi:hypothetical protein
MGNLVTWSIKDETTCSNTQLLNEVKENLTKPEGILLYVIEKDEGFNHVHALPTANHEENECC